MSSRSKLVALSLLLAALGCEDYDPPPEATLELPEGGAFAEGEQLVITFSEEIDPATLDLVVWPNERDIENEIAEGTKPLVESCGADDECGDFTTELRKGGKELRIDLSGDLGKPGRPLILTLQPGLADKAGNDTGAATNWDIQFRAAGGVNDEPVEFDNGNYILLAQVDKPLPAVLTLISEVIVLPDGRFALAGAEGDEKEGFPKNTRNPEELYVDETNLGFTAYAVGFVTLTDDGKRLLESEAFDVTLPVTGGLTVNMKDVRLFADIVKNEETGTDRLDGTLSFSSLTLVRGDTEIPADGGSTALVADFVEPDILPEGTPEICGNLCGAVVDGLCAPPEDFPNEDFCAAAQE